MTKRTYIRGVYRSWEDDMEWDPAIVAFARKCWKRRLQRAMARRSRRINRRR